MMRRFAAFLAYLVLTSATQAEVVSCPDSWGHKDPTENLRVFVETIKTEKQCPSDIGQWLNWRNSVISTIRSHPVVPIAHLNECLNLSSTPYLKECFQPIVEIMQSTISKPLSEQEKPTNSQLISLPPELDAAAAITSTTDSTAVEEKVKQFVKAYPGSHIVKKIVAPNTLPFAPPNETFTL